MMPDGQLETDLYIKPLHQQLYLDYRSQLFHVEMKLYGQIGGSTGQNKLGLSCAKLSSSWG